VILFKVPSLWYRISEFYDATRRKLLVANGQYWCNRVTNQDVVTWLQHVEGTGACRAEGPWSLRSPIGAANRLALSPCD
jgi:hypothetical protein